MTKTDTDTDTDAEVTPPAGRFVTWFALAAFNVIALVALNSQLDFDLKDESQEHKWCISSMIITLTLAVLGVVGHSLRKKFIGTPIEGGLALFTLGMWCAVLPAMMKPSNNIAQSRSGTIENANLYFFSWGAFFMAMSILVGYLHDAHGIGKSMRNKSFKASAWGALMAASFVTMASAIRLYKSRNCDDIDDGTDFCDRTTFAMSIGLVSGIIALIWMLLGARLPSIADVILGWLMLVAWVFAIGYITFGNDEDVPARNIGNLYFATWAGFILSCLLASDSLRSLFLATMGGGGGETPTAEAKPDKAVAEEDVAVDEEFASAEEVAADTGDDKK